MKNFYHWVLSALGAEPTYTCQPPFEWGELPELPLFIEGALSPRKVMWVESDGGFLVTRTFDEPIPIWKKFNKIESALLYLYLLEGDPNDST